MRIARWGAAAGAVLLVSLPIAAQAEVTPSPGTNVGAPSLPAGAPSGAGGTSVAQPSGASNVTSGASHVAPVSHVGTSSVRGTVVRHSVNRSSNVRTSSTHNSVTHAGTVHSAGTGVVVVPAPPSVAEAYAANILNAIAISHTKASAGGNGGTTGSATANALELGGNPPASAFGGTVTNGSGSGDVIDTTKLMIPTNALYLAVAPWSASASPTNSSAIADLLVLTLGDTQGNPSQSATVKVLQSTSNANWTSGQSTSNATSDGAFINLGGPSGLTIDLLHSDTSSTTPGTSYLISINGNQIPPNGSVGSACAINIPSLLSLSCLTATGGLGSTGLNTGSSGVITSTLLPGPGNLPLNLFTSNAGSGLGSSLPGVSGGSGGGGLTGNGGTGPKQAAPHAAASGAHHRLAFTGLDTPMLLGIAVLLLTAGTGIIWLVRRPRAAGLA